MLSATANEFPFGAALHALRDAQRQGLLWEQVQGIMGGDFCESAKGGVHKCERPHRHAANVDAFEPQRRDQEPGLRALQGRVH